MQHIFFNNENKDHEKGRQNVENEGELVFFRMFEDGYWILFHKDSFQICGCVSTYWIPLKQKMLQLQGLSENHKVCFDYTVEAVASELMEFSR